MKITAKLESGGGVFGAAESGLAIDGIKYIKLAGQGYCAQEVLGQEELAYGGATKIHCGKEHFKTLENGVDYELTTDWKALKKRSNKWGVNE